MVHSKIPGLHLRFAFCNLSERSIFSLAEALEKNTSLKGFSCFQNPCNFPDGNKFDPNAPCEQRIKQSLAATLAPIEIWNNYPIPEEIVKARHAVKDRQVAKARQEEAARRAEEELQRYEQQYSILFDLLEKAEISADRSLKHKYVRAFVDHGLDRLDRFAKASGSDLNAVGIKLGDAIDIIDAAQQQMKGRRSLSFASVPKPRTSVTSTGTTGIDNSNEHLLFFSYAQKDCPGETLHLAQYAAAKFPGASIFKDTNVKFKLNELVEHVSRSKNVIVVLSENYCRRPFALVELHTALQVKANLITVRATRPGLGQFDYGQVQKDIAEGSLYNYLDESGWALLDAYGVDIEDVANDLKTVMNVASIALDILAPESVITAMMDVILNHVAT